MEKAFNNIACLTSFKAMERLKKIYKYLTAHLTKIQLLVIIAITAYVFLISESNIFARLGYDLEIRKLENEIEHYKNKTKEDRLKLEELDADKEQIEKFARENYLMKKKGEDIFIID